MGILQFVLALCMVGAIKIWAPVCQNMLTLDSGKNIPMKCFHTSKAGIMLILILLACSALVIFCKNTKPVQIISCITAVLLVWTFTKGIGVCMNSQMQCNITKVWVMGLGMLYILLGCIALFSDKEGQLPR